VDSLVERTSPTVRKVGNNLRVLDYQKSMKDKVLLLAYHSRAAVLEADVFGWVEHSNASVFRRDVVRPLHKTKLIK
jgi:hypothetical protein